jgi:hypothetical protein
VARIEIGQKRRGRIRLDDIRGRIRFADFCLHAFTIPRPFLPVVSRITFISRPYLGEIQSVLVFQFYCKTALIRCVLVVFGFYMTPTSMI